MLISVFLLSFCNNEKKKTKKHIMSVMEVPTHDGAAKTLFLLAINVQLKFLPLRMFPTATNWSTVNVIVGVQ